MSRLFDGQFSAEAVTFSVGTAPTDEGPITIAALVKPQTTVSSGTCWIVSGLVSGSPILGVVIDAGTLFMANDFTSGGPTVTGGTTWYWIVVTKASGSATPRYHIKNVTSGGAWSHTNGTGNVSDAAGPITSIIVGAESGTGTNDFRGSIAALAMWDTALADLSVESACTLAASDLLGAAPKWMTRWNQASTGTNVTDDTGGGGNQTAISGTSVDADDPPGWSYALTASTTNYAGPYLGPTPGRLGPTGHLTPQTPGAARAPQVLAAGIASETDTALPLGRAKARAAGIGAETDTAQGLGRAKAKTLGVATESDTVQSLGRSKTLAVGLATETDTVLPASATQTAATPYAGPWTGPTPGWFSPTGHLSPWGGSNSTVGNVTSATVGAAAETDTAQPLGKTKAKTLGIAAETDTVVAAGRAKRRLVGAAAETDTVLAASIPGRVTTTTETDTALPLGRLKRKTAGVATTIDAALALGRRKVKTLGVATETDTAVAFHNPASQEVGTAAEVDTVPVRLHRARRITPRPNAGTTTRPDTGITLRP